VPEDLATHLLTEVSLRRFGEQAHRDIFNVVGWIRDHQLR
jgi:hypothetical protein